MTEIREKLLSIERKHKLFKQQQFIYITALERSREQARDKAEPVSSVAQVQRYMTHHCSNATDRRIFSLFLEIIADLETVFKLLESSASTQSQSSEALETCKKLLNPNSNISQLRAHYPHDEVNRLSCNEARNYYGGVVSVIPLAIDLLKVASFALTRTSIQATALTQTATNGPLQQTEASKADNMSADLSRKVPSAPSRPRQAATKHTGMWQAGKPAWKPPGHART